MKAATIHSIKSAQFEKLGLIDTADAISIRIEYATLALRFAGAVSGIEAAGYKRSIAEGDFSYFCAGAIAIRILEEVESLADHMYDAKTGGAQ